MSTNDFVEVPPPLWKFQGAGTVHDDNLKILQAAQDERSVLLTDIQVSKLRQKLRETRRELARLHADKRLKQYDEHKRAFHSKRLRIVDLEQAEEVDSAQIATLQQEMRIIANELHKLRDELKPARALSVQAQRIEQRLLSHYTAAETLKKENELQLLMAREAQLIANQMSMTLARCGFHSSVTIGKKTYVKHVKFERVITTPDQHQFKIAASRQGLMGGTVDLLPQGVLSVDILQENIMRELSAALEREVWSPHVGEDVRNTNGAWIVVERMGLYEGIPKNVTYRQIMARYETADHDRIPLPAGLKKGRRVNWTYLDHHSSTHIMFTGITGSGKSNAVQACISAVVEKQSPADAMFVIIDLKNQGDFNELADAPHVLAFNEKRIITDIGDVVGVLAAVRAEMHYRQRRISAVAKNITQYNKRVEEQDRMPRIIIMFDEYANTRRGRFAEEASIIDDICTEITQIGRASGIHLWIGIQQPRASNMPQALRDNFTTMFAGHQASVGAAQSVTGNRASLRLTGLPGRMMCTLGWNSYEVQMPFITDEDQKEAVALAKTKFGDLTPYKLYSPEATTGEDGEAIVIPIAPIGNREIIIQTAFDQFEGALKISPIHAAIGGKVSRPNITKIVKQMADDGKVEWRGDCYEVVKQSGNFYKLIPAE